jgi:excisionase family DNA binding protein
MHQLNPLLLADQAAVILNVKAGTVYDWAAKGILPHIRILAGRRRPVIRFRLDELEQFLRERATPCRRADG